MAGTEAASMQSDRSAGKESRDRITIVLFSHDACVEIAPSKGGEGLP
jgi:hypothetical protein